MRRQQGAQVVAGGHGRQAGEDIAQVVVRVVAAALAGDDQRVEDGGAGAGVGVADEEAGVGGVVGNDRGCAAR